MTNPPTNPRQPRKAGGAAKKTGAQSRAAAPTPRPASAGRAAVQQLTAAAEADQEAFESYINFGAAAARAEQARTALAQAVGTAAAFSGRVIVPGSTVFSPTVTTTADATATATVTTTANANTSTGLPTTLKKSKAPMLVATAVGAFVMIVLWHIISTYGPGNNAEIASDGWLRMALIIAVAGVFGLVAYYKTPAREVQQAAGVLRFWQQDAVQPGSTAPATATTPTP